MKPLSARVILHIDMDAYFAAVEQRENPALRGKPLLVVGDSKRRSVVMTASYEARASGVKTGMNLYQAKRLCPGALVVDGNAKKYLKVTAEILKVLEAFSDQIELSSCDEAYLDVTGSLACFGTDGEGLARRIKQNIRTVTGLTCSVGVAPNKLLAKLASEKKKPDGLTVIPSEEVPRVLAETPVEDLCGVGEKLKAKLHRIGIRTCRDLGEAGLGLLQNHFGFWGFWLKRMGRGEDDSPVKRVTESESPKSIGHSTTFPRDSSDPGILDSYLLLLSEKVARRTRQAALQGTTVTLTIRYKDFTTFSRQHKREHPTDDGQEIYRAARSILREQEPLAQPVRLLGVSLSGLVPGQWQEFLYETLSRRRKANAAMDAINRKFGSFTLRPAGMMPAEKFGVLPAPVPPSAAGARLLKND